MNTSNNYKRKSKCLSISTLKIIIKIWWITIMIVVVNKIITLI